MIHIGWFPSLINETTNQLGDMAAKKEEKKTKLGFFISTRRPRVNQEGKTPQNPRREDFGTVLRIRCSPIPSRTRAVACPPAVRSSAPPPPLSPARAAAAAFPRAFLLHARRHRSSPSRAT
jgi:hypothetical protein